MYDVQISRVWLSFCFLQKIKKMDKKEKEEEFANAEEDEQQVITTQ